MKLRIRQRQGRYYIQERVALLFWLDLNFESWASREEAEAARRRILGVAGRE